MTDFASPGEGYQWLEPGRCRGCSAVMGWWLTPRERRSPHDPDGTSHFVSCPERDRFRRRQPPRSGA